MIRFYAEKMSYYLKFNFHFKRSSKIVLKLLLKKPSSNYHTPSSYDSTDTKIFTKIEQELALYGSQSIWFQSKYIFDHGKDQNRIFCQARMKVYDLGYLFLGWISSSQCASREKHKKHQKFRNHLMFFKQIYIIIEFWARKKLKIKNQIRWKYIIWFE